MLNEVTFAVLRVEEIIVFKNSRTSEKKKRRIWTKVVTITLTIEATDYIMHV